MQLDLARSGAALSPVSSERIKWEALELEIGEISSPVPIKHHPKPDLGLVPKRVPGHILILTDEDLGSETNLCRV